MQRIALLGLWAACVCALPASTRVDAQTVTRHAKQINPSTVVALTASLPPATPVAVSPTAGTQNVALTSSLAWSAAGATTYDLSFGTSNPPVRVAVGVTASSYSPAMTGGTTYFWQVTARNANGATIGSTWSFTTAVAALPTGVATGAPSYYNALSDRLAYTKPPVPPLGAAGYAFTDPTFGSRMLRITDGNTRPGLPNRAFRVSSNAHLADWNASSTAFVVVSDDGTVIPYSFNPSAMTASRIQASGTGNGGLTLSFYVEPQFSLVQPNIIYGAGGANNRTLMQYDFNAGVYTTIINLDNVVSGLSGYVGGLMTGGTAPETLLVFFGGGEQDQHFYALWQPLSGGTSKLLNSVASTINGVPTPTLLNFHLHSVQIDKTGRYVLLYPASADLAAPRSASQVYIWDTATDNVTAVDASMHPGGHDAAGYGYWINQDCCTSSTWDAAQWQFRSLASPALTSDLISPVLTPEEIYLADHTTWNNAQPTVNVPVISATYRYGNNRAPWRAWDDEIIAIQTTSGTGGTVWRFAHHRSNVGSDADPTTPYFWYEPTANVSPDGHWVIFTSNWEKTLGTDAADGTAREDVFLVELKPE